MRNLKFRTWDTEYQEFSEWTNRDPHFSTTHNQLFFWERTRNEDGSYGGDIILEDLGDRFVLQQYTGLFYQNQREICEGDIFNTLEARWVVEYYTAAFYARVVGGAVLPLGDRILLSEIVSRSLVPLGNIFENPGLVLKGT